MTLSIEERIGNTTEREVPYMQIALYVRKKRARKVARIYTGCWGETVEEATQKLEARIAELSADYAECKRSENGMRGTKARLQVWADGTEMVFVPMFF